jgi:hypothetical protein
MRFFGCLRTAKTASWSIAAPSGREVQGVQLEHLTPIREDRGQETLVTFDLDGQSQHTRFVMYAKALPRDLIEEVSRRSSFPASGRLRERRGTRSEKER